MQIDSNELRQTLIKMKDQLYFNLDKARHNKVKNILEANISLIESFLIWIHNSEKLGEANMETLKISLGNTVKLDEIVESRSKIDPAIIETAKGLRSGEATAIDPEQIKWTYFANRVYALKKDKKLPEDVKPIKRGEKFYLARI